jgi:chromosomal replication initiation ATPase DnaA
MKDDELFQSPEEMRLQTQEYVFAVTVAHPELVPLDAEIFDPYPRQFTKKDGAFGTILQEVATESGYTLSELLGESRRQGVVHARWKVYERAVKAGYGVTEIGRRMNKDHSTINHGLRGLKKLYAKPLV